MPIDPVTVIIAAISTERKEWLRCNERCFDSGPKLFLKFASVQNRRHSLAGGPLLMLESSFLPF